MGTGTSPHNTFEVHNRSTETPGAFGADGDHEGATGQPPATLGVQRGRIMVVCYSHDTGLRWHHAACFDTSSLGSAAWDEESDEEADVDLDEAGDPGTATALRAEGEAVATAAAAGPSGSSSASHVRRLSYLSVGSVGSASTGSRALTPTTDGPTSSRRRRHSVTLNLNRASLTFPSGSSVASSSPVTTAGGAANGSGSGSGGGGLIGGAAGGAASASGARRPTSLQSTASSIGSRRRRASAGVMHDKNVVGAMELLSGSVTQRPHSLNDALRGDVATLLSQQQQRPHSMDVSIMRRAHGSDAATGGNNDASAASREASPLVPVGRGSPTGTGGAAAARHRSSGGSIGSTSRATGAGSPDVDGAAASTARRRRSNKRRGSNISVTSHLSIASFLSASSVNSADRNSEASSDGPTRAVLVFVDPESGNRLALEVTEVRSCCCCCRCCY